MASFPTDNCLYNTVTIQPNEPFNLPPGAQLISASDINSLKSTCPLPTELASPICGQFFLAIDVDDNSGHPMNEEDTRIRNLNVGGTILNFSDQRIIVSSDNPGDLIDLNTLNSYIPVSFRNVFRFTSVSRNVLSKRQDVTFVFEILDVFADQVEMQVVCLGVSSYFKRRGC